MSPNLPEDELRIRLRAAADEHRPDRAAMLARIERRRGDAADGSAGSRPGPHRLRTGVLRPAEGRRAAGRLSPLAAAAALGAVMVLGVGGTWVAVDQLGSPVQRDPVGAPAAPPAPTSAPGAVASPEDGAIGTPPPSSSPSATPVKPRTPARTSKPSASPLPIPEMPGGSAPEHGWLWSDGSVDPHSISSWSQSNVTLKNDTPVTALDVTIRVALTAGVRTTGSWSSVPDQLLTLSVQERPGWLYYRFRLREGATLAPGSYVFAAQFNHATGGRDAGRDAYLASARAGATDVEVHGTFAAGN